MEYELIVKCCDNSTDGGEIMEVLSNHSGQEIRKPGTCECSVNQQRKSDYDSSHDSYYEAENDGNNEAKIL